LTVEQEEILIIIPTLNEVKSIQNLIDEIFLVYPSIHVLVVDDGSKDGTITLLNGLKLKYQNLQIFNREKRFGLGSAYRFGFTFAIENKYPFVIQMDGDGSHQIKDLKTLLAANKHYDLVIGSRYVPGGKITGWKQSRRFISRVGNKLAQRTLRLDTNDTTSGFKRISKKVFAHATILNSKTNGYGFQIEITYTCESLNLSVLEVPIEFIERKYGISKFNLMIIIEALFNLIKWSVK
jgi:dolichol-phosphate mannosyltransferase